jgi:hypothetical protein
MVGASLFGATPKREAIAPPGFCPFFLGTEKRGKGYKEEVLFLFCLIGSY